MLILNKHPSQQRKPSKQSLSDGDVLEMMLDAMSVSELTDALAGLMETEDYDPALIEAYLDALDRKEPMPQIPDADTSYADLKRKMQVYTPGPVRRPPSGRPWRMGRVGLVAALTLACMLATMAIAQAAGVDLLGAVARWTNERFSFGRIQSMDVPAEAETVYDRRPIDHDMEYASLQDALDTYGITEVSSPAWLPDGYTLNDIDVIYLADSDFLYINAEYTCEDQVMHFEIVDYTAGPIVQVEKTSAPVELFEIDGIDVYLFENINNSAASWLTDHFECHITGVVDVETLKHVVLSIYSK